ncbi:uncharacterized protein Z520_01694 [Fonsecaea multimorphosa CBS 102226]|uniref:Uncharacterized protein n=1 Tax=Fonsecaea multimorphosa CBS 102226 TaxID=1442371 RepID=A0A0D2J1F4_9EURO|nr:uncharacterized protein Z520_01694 [Fonsecaea multimorphosa CBS 102226]KIY03227.1 hypothetical protein Z520_01694 [Fonsecaea multimorphosa CBS 102226]
MPIMPVKETGFVQMTELNQSNASLPNSRQDPWIPTAWPSDPKPLANDRINEILLDLYDVGLCLIPIALMVKIGLCLKAESMDDEDEGYFIDEVGPLTTYLIRFNGQLATAFTIVFVLIFTTFLKRLALWRAQKGEYVARLEQYQASMSLISTLRSVLFLRAFDSISVGLIIMWSFYYLGSQASKEEFKYQVSGPPSNHLVAYRSFSAPSAFQNATYTGYPQSFFEHLNLQYGVYVTYGQKSQNSDTSPNPSDYTGAALVPFPEGYPWTDVSKSSEYWYASFAGCNVYPLWDYDTLAMAFVGDYNFETSFLQAECSNWTLLHGSQFPNGTTKPIVLAMNMSDSAAVHKANNYTSPRTFTISAQHNSSVAVQVSCTIVQKHVELEVHCTGASCGTRRMRDSRQQHPSENSTPFDDDIFAERFFQNLVSINQLTTKNAISWGTVDDAFFDDYTGKPLPTYAGILENIRNNVDGDGDFVSLGITQVLNTYYYTSQLKRSNPVYFPLNSTDIDSVRADPDFAITPMRGAEYNPRYATNKAWIAVDCVSQAVLFGAAMAAFWLRKNTIAPDIFGYVSSLTRDNPHIDLPDGGTTLGGLERARLLRNVKVRIADVSRDGQVGHVGLVAETRHADYLSPQKVYA